VITDANLAVYEQADVVKTYQHIQQLTKGERLFFSRHEADYRNKKVLDLGVGAGRTTPALAALASEYWGIDYSHAMVEACKAAFSALPNVRFHQDDARTLSNCPEGYFDAVIFSFNGIDIVDMEGRKAVLEATKRVLKDGGVFVFSFHNAGYLDKLYQYHWQKNPLRWWANFQRQQRIKSINGAKEQYAGKDYFFLKDGGEDFRLDICYIRPSYQQQMLQQAGFRLEHIVESLSGKELQPGELDASKDSWLYYRCTKA
jgi:ubiquinone/menaquinone biosynthesis C-methylase UbiE